MVDIVIMSLRTYALFDCNKPLLYGLLFLSGVSVHILERHAPEFSMLLI